MKKEEQFMMNQPQFTKVIERNSKLKGLLSDASHRVWTGSMVSDHSKKFMLVSDQNKNEQAQNEPKGRKAKKPSANLNLGKRESESGKLLMGEENKISIENESFLANEVREAEDSLIASRDKKYEEHLRKSREKFNTIFRTAIKDRKPLSGILLYDELFGKNPEQWDYAGQLDVYNQHRFTQRNKKKQERAKTKGFFFEESSEEVSNGKGKKRESRMNSRKQSGSGGEAVENSNSLNGFLKISPIARIIEEESFESEEKGQEMSEEPKETSANEVFSQVFFKKPAGALYNQGISENEGFDLNSQSLFGLDDKKQRGNNSTGPGINSMRMENNQPGNRSSNQSKREESEKSSLGGKCLNEKNAREVPKEQRDSIEIKGDKTQRENTLRSINEELKDHLIREETAANPVQRDFIEENSKQNTNRSQEKANQEDLLERILTLEKETVEESTGFFNDLNKLDLFFPENNNFAQEASDPNTSATAGKDIFEQVKELLRIFGIPYVESPAEAEAQCVFLEKNGLVDGIITEDSDVFPLGAKRVFRSFFSQGIYAYAFDSEVFEKELGLNTEQIIHLSLFLGSDYSLGIRGVGIVNAMEIVEAFQSLEALIRFREWAKAPDLFLEDSDKHYEGVAEKEREYKLYHKNFKKSWELPETFPDMRVIDAYRHPLVDGSLQKFEWGRPDFDKIKAFTNKFMLLSENQFNEMILPLKNVKGRSFWLILWFLERAADQGREIPAKTHRFLRRKPTIRGSQQQKAHGEHCELERRATQFWSRVH